MLAPTRTLVCIVVLASCRSAGPAPQRLRSQPPGSPAPHAEVATLDTIDTIVAAIVPIVPGGAAIDIETPGAAIAACEAAGWPDRLPDATARGLPEQGVGSHAVVVHPGGITTVTVVGIECQAPGDIEGPVASLLLDAPAPAGPPDPRTPAAVRGGVPTRPHLAIVGADVAAEARLVDPVPLDLSGAATTREALTRYASDVAEERREACIERGSTEGVPSTAAITRAVPEAVASAVVHTLRAGDQALVFAVLQHEGIGFGCSGVEEQLGVLLDPKNGEVLLELTSNNGIELQWITDLDGDGIEEALVDMQWIEDGMHDIGVVHGQGSGWTNTIVWSAPTP